MKLTFDYLNNKTYPFLYEQDGESDLWIEVYYYGRFKTCQRCIHCILADELVFHIICDSPRPEWAECFDENKRSNICNVDF
jgi:hypothetical protein